MSGKTSSPENLEELGSYYFIPDSFFSFGVLSSRLESSSISSSSSIEEIGANSFG